MALLGPVANHGHHVGRRYAARQMVDFTSRPEGESPLAGIKARILLYPLPLVVGQDGEATADLPQTVEEIGRFLLGRRVEGGRASSQHRML